MKELTIIFNKIAKFWKYSAKRKWYAVFWNGSVFKNYTLLQIFIYSFKVFETISFPLYHEYNFTKTTDICMCVYIFILHPFKPPFIFQFFRACFTPLFCRL